MKLTRRERKRTVHEAWILDRESWYWWVADRSSFAFLEAPLTRTLDEIAHRLGSLWDLYYRPRLFLLDPQDYGVAG